MATLPSTETVVNTLTTLLRRRAHVSVAKPAASQAIPIVGVYRSGDGVPVAACLSDVAFSAYAAAAFSLIPCRVADESIKAGALEEGLEDIFGEVLNVLSRLFMAHETQRITLLSKSFPPAAVAENVMTAQGDSVDLDIDIDGYGSGRLSLRLL